ncbi:uncharacterized protein LOC133372434 isoform X1 [Rhineura floridana]|uniref:uncharacterized protein LOC133372434 isoform X1 n=1 Tax=Rhineura floridana TaxID=261503 RepID=UPI002AC84928|nr:uncharacterized protein LOC133372434 isoform X1 [Rhineura floridana]
MEYTEKILTKIQVNDNELRLESSTSFCDTENDYLLRETKTLLLSEARQEKNLQQKEGKEVEQEKNIKILNLEKESKRFETSQRSCESSFGDGDAEGEKEVEYETEADESTTVMEDEEIEVYGPEGLPVVEGGARETRILLRWEEQLESGWLNYHTWLLAEPGGSWDMLKLWGFLVAHIAVLPAPAGPNLTKLSRDAILGWLDKTHMTILAALQGTIPGTMEEMALHRTVTLGVVKRLLVGRRARTSTRKLPTWLEPVEMERMIQDSARGWETKISANRCPLIWQSIGQVNSTIRRQDYIEWLWRLVGHLKFWWKIVRQAQPSSGDRMMTSRTPVTTSSLVIESAITKEEQKKSLEITMAKDCLIHHEQLLQTTIPESSRRTVLPDLNWQKKPQSVLQRTSLNRQPPTSGGMET